MFNDKMITNISRLWVRLQARIREMYLDFVASEEVLTWS